MLIPSSRTLHPAFEDSPVRAPFLERFGSPIRIAHDGPKEKQARRSCVCLLMRRLRFFWRLQRHHRSRELLWAHTGALLVENRDPVLWLINAAGFLGEGVTGQRIGARTRAAADFLVFTGAALALQPTRIAESLED